MKKTISILLIIMVALVAANAQSSRIHISGVFPTGDFGDDDFGSSKSGHAGFGFNIGYRYYIPFSVPNLSFAIGLDVFYNDLKSDSKDYMERNYSNYDITFPKYINIPLTGGVNYTYPINEKVGIYGEFGLGLNCSFETIEKYERKNSDYEEKIKYNPSFKVCYGLEGGVLLSNKFTLGLRYNQLGTHKYKYTLTDNVSSGKEKGKLSKQPISTFSIVAGIRF